MLDETPAWYFLSATEDVTAFCSRWLSGSAWHQLPHGTQCMLLYFNCCRYVFRLPHKGQTPGAMAADARKAIACLTRLAEVLEGEEPVTVPPAPELHPGPAPELHPGASGACTGAPSSDRHIPVTALPPGLQALAGYAAPGERCYYAPASGTMHRHRAHEWAVFEAQHQGELASGALKRVVLKGEVPNA